MAIESIKSTEYQLLDTLRDDEPRYAELGHLVAGEMVETYLAPIVAYNVGHEANVALSFVSGTGLPEAVDVIKTASEHENTGEIHDWTAAAVVRMQERQGLDKIEGVMGVDEWVKSNFEDTRAYAALAAGEWYGAALERGTDITPATLETLRGVYDAATHDPGIAEYMQGQYPDFMGAIGVAESAPQAEDH